MVGKCFIYIHFSKPSKFVMQCFWKMPLLCFHSQLHFERAVCVEGFFSFFVRLPWYSGMAAKYFIFLILLNSLSLIMSIEFIFSFFNTNPTETFWIAQFHSDQKTSENKVTLKLKNNATLLSYIFRSEQNWASCGGFVVFGIRNGEQMQCWQSGKSVCNWWEGWIKFF